MKFIKKNQDEARELKEANRANEKDLLQNTCLLPN